MKSEKCPNSIILFFIIWACSYIWEKVNNMKYENRQKVGILIVCAISGFLGFIIGVAFTLMLLMSQEVISNENNNIRDIPPSERRAPSQWINWLNQV